VEEAKEASWVVLDDEGGFVGGASWSWMEGAACGEEYTGCGDAGGREAW
jgi:hypothetical protein